MSKQSQELTDFYYAYAKWLDEGAPHMQPFSRNTGLCHASFIYDDRKGTLRRELTSQLSEAGLSSQYPFNQDGDNDYADESDNETLHLNPKRIRWVWEHCL